MALSTALRTRHKSKSFAIARDWCNPSPNFQPARFNGNFVGHIPPTVVGVNDRNANTKKVRIHRWKTKTKTKTANRSDETNTDSSVRTNEHTHTHTHTHTQPHRKARKRRFITLVQLFGCILSTRKQSIGTERERERERETKDYIVRHERWQRPSQYRCEGYRSSK